MKTIIRLSFAAAVVMLAAGCAKENASKGGSFFSITVNADDSGKTILRNGSKVNWVKDDKLQVFTDAQVRVQFTTTDSDVPTAVFTTTEWPEGAKPTYATSTYGSTSCACTTDGVITTLVNNSQVHYNVESYGKFASASVGKIEESDGAYSIEEMKNVTGLIKFSFEGSGSAAIKSMKVESVGGESVSGWVNVDYAKLVAGDADFWTAATGKAQYSSVTTSCYATSSCASPEGGFKSGVIYYVAVLPQTYSKGLRLTLTRADGTEASRIMGGSGLTINRSKIKVVETPLDHALTFTKADIVLDFTTIGASTFKYNNGETVSNFPSRSGTNWVEDVDFWAAAYPDYIFHGSVRYWSTSNGCLNQKANTYVKLPAIAGFKLSEITDFKVVHSAARGYTITNSTDAVSEANTVGATKSLSISSDLASWTLTDTYSAATDYYIYSASEGGYKFKLIYKPVE